MDNSLQEIAGSFTFAAMKLKLITATALAALFGLTLTPLSSSAEPVCVGSECTVTFEYTGTYEVFTVPSGAKNLRFDVQGARGGRFGGLGGQVTGSLGDLTGELFIFVGGQGGEGSNLPGGFNGGGQSGGNHADEGSGGGASDIRTSLSPQDRIVVAGGGGGTGGWSGATGGAGGGLVAVAGSSGQGGGGAPGTQTSGGSPGSSNGGYVGSAGGFGQGGTGGFSAVSGGGGGGGGWFGGGGGGADIDTCCSDGGGGGGGSSYTYPLAQNVAHAQGVRSGNGLIVLSYSLPPQVTNFILSQTGPASAIAEIDFASDIQQLSLDDFSFNGASCDAELAGSGSSYSMVLEECTNNYLVLELKPYSVTNGVLGPSLATLVELTLDQSPPQIGLGFPSSVSTSTTLTLSGFVDGAVNELSEDSFELSGCEGMEMISSSPFQLRLFDCQQGEVSVELSADSVWDQWGNSSPATPIRFLAWVDSLGPEPKFVLKESSSTGALIELLEVTDGWHNKVFVDVGPTGCEIEYLNQFIVLEDCSPGLVSFSLEAGVMIDEFGNSGPLTPQFFSHEFEALALIETLPVPEPKENQPVLETGPVPSTDPVRSEPNLGLPQIDEPESEGIPLPDAISPEQPAVLEETIEVTVLAELEPERVEATEELVVVAESAVSETEPQSEANADSLNTLSVSGSHIETDRPNWLTPLLAFAFLAALIVGVVGYRLIGK